MAKGLRPSREVAADILYDLLHNPSLQEPEDTPAHLSRRVDFIHKELVNAYEDGRTDAEEGFSPGITRARHIPRRDYDDD